jgi:O-antigen/teichoic acid export membrane protein
MLPYIAFGFLKEFGDRWILQKWGGDFEQGVFSVSERLTAIVLLINSSVIKIFWRETAKYNFSKNLKKLENIYINTICIVSLLGALIITVFVPFIELIDIFVLDTNKQASLTIYLMLTVPIFVSINQLQTTFLYATLNITPHTIMAIFSFVLGFTISILLVSSYSIFGYSFELGAPGIALKLLLMGFIGLFMYSFYINSKFRYSLSYIKTLRIIYFPVLIIAIISLIIKYIIPGYVILNSVLSFSFYIVAIFFLYRNKPLYFGLNIDQYDLINKNILNILTSLKSKYNHVK